MISIEQLINITDENMFLLKRCSSGYIVGDSYYSVVLSKKLFSFDELCKKIKEPDYINEDFTGAMAQINVDQILRMYKDCREFYYANIWYMSHSIDGILNILDYKDEDVSFTFDFLTSNYFWIDRKVYKKLFSENGNLK